MRSVPLPLLLLCLSLCTHCLRRGQPLPGGGTNVEKRPLDDNMREAESLILQSVLKKSEEEKINKESNTPLPEWLSKRQHPGKRYISDLEKRQHPGKREDAEESSYGDIQKRQHPGKREEEGSLARYLELKKRQHPGRRSLWDQHADTPSAQLTYLNELSKRQHPGKRYLPYKLQHPGSRGWNDEQDLRDQHVEKRQHPGKRYLDTKNPEYAAPCDFQESSSCNEGSLLLDLVEDVSRVEEKRQHPGGGLAWESEAEE
ncbi:Pro-thyrotropin-releasing hormone [Tinamus guttatus]|uniref:Pro-thyrotropin-releasing hormone n=1 Tax=Tinamus guttatus TaxID=94827 RepID=A0A099YTJ5_TINGU|nr:PREDICTED: thyrotropin releasing hormone [Tinamus guttatus]KGL72656.1 Pro-thyrotropin-releasing hormone [Tinamus guttatus]